MPSPLDDATQALDDAIAARRQTRYRKLLRAVRNQRIRTGVVFGLAVFMALITLAAFVTGDREAGIIIGLMTVGHLDLRFSLGRLIERTR